MESSGPSAPIRPNRFSARTTIMTSGIIAEIELPAHQTGVPMTYIGDEPNLLGVEPPQGYEIGAQN